MRVQKVVNGLLAVGALASFAVVYWWVDAMGILLGLMVATATVLHVTGQRSASTRTIFAFGFHAGYHSAPETEACFGESCPIIEIAEARVEQLYSVSA